MNLKKMFCLLLATLLPVLAVGCGEKEPVTPPIDPQAAAPAATAVTIGNHKLTAVEFTYYYRDTVDAFYNGWANGYILGENVADFDPALPLNEQYYDAATETTWADYLIREALSDAKYDYILSGLAKAASFTLPAKYKASLETQRSYLSQNADLYGYADVDSFLGAYYSPEHNEKNYMAYKERQLTAEAYEAFHRESLTYSESVLRSHDTGEYETCPMGNVRHLLVKFEDSEADEATNGITYSDAEKEAAKKKAQEYLDIWKNGAANEDHFIELVKKYSQDTYLEDGGLYENIHPESNYVDNFKNWATDPARKAGETGIIETEYGYHVMYFVGWSKLSYRDYMITEQLRDGDQKVWLQEILDNVEAEILDYSGLELDLVLDTGVTELY